MALGARAWQMVALVAREGAILVVAGAGLGVAGALLAARSLQHQLYAITPGDPVTLAAVAALVVAAAGFAIVRPGGRSRRD